MPFASTKEVSHHNPLVNWLIGLGAPLETEDDDDSLGSSKRSPASSAENGAPFDQARKMAMVGQMTNGIAHDFNNQLQTIMSSLFAIERRISRGDIVEVPRLMGFALESAAAAAALSRRLLEFSRADSPSVQPVALNAAIASLGDLLRWTLGPRIELVLALDDGLSEVSCDRNQFENVVLNLAINARDAMPFGGSLRIETCHADLVVAYNGLPRGRYLRMCLSDDGCGMEPHVLERALEPFFTTKPFGEGTGLGLSISKAFVDQCRGHIDIKSVVGVGTAVSLYLPCF
jgi:signal transduction histidine kinase